MDNFIFNIFRHTNHRGEEAICIEATIHIQTKTPIPFEIVAFEMTESKQDFVPYFNTYLEIKKRISVEAADIFLIGVLHGICFEIRNDEHSAGIFDLESEELIKKLFKLASSRKQPINDVINGHFTRE